MENESRVAETIKMRVKSDPELQKKIQADPVSEIDDLVQEVMRDISPLNYDRWIYRLVVGALGLTIIIVVIGAIILAMGSSTTPRETPQILTAIGSAAVGALAGLLAPSPGNK